jgi:hypothetical protein
MTTADQLPPGAPGGTPPGQPATGVASIHGAEGKPGETAAAPAVAGAAQAGAAPVDPSARRPQTGTAATTVRAGLPRVAPDRPLAGSLDGVDHGYEVSGWVVDMSQPTRACGVELRVDGKVLAQVRADVPRPDLTALRIRPDCGFRITIPAAVFDGAIHALEVWVQPEGVRLGQRRPLAGVIRDHKPYPKIFSVDSILRLEDGVTDYDRVFGGAFLQRHGVRAAVAYAYLWLLKRPPDRSGWDHYCDKILAGEMGLGDCLRELAASEEGIAARRSGIDLVADFEAVLAAAARLPRPLAGGATDVP